MVLQAQTKYGEQISIPAIETEQCQYVYIGYHHSGA